MRSRKEAILVVLRSFRIAQRLVAQMLGMVVVSGVICYGAIYLADWASPDAGKTWITVFLGSYVGCHLLVPLVAYCWSTYRRARHG